MAYLADDVGTPIIKAIDGASEVVKLLYWGSLLFIFIFAIFMLLMYLLRKRMLKKERPKKP